jgi:hypothetical protein
VNNLPTSIQLSPSEQSELSARIAAAARYGATPTIAQFWREALAARGVALPAHGKLPLCVPQRGAGTYRLQWQTCRLGQQAIAEGKKYRLFQEERERKYEQEKGFRL